MSRRLPEPITKEEFDKMLVEARKERDRFWRPRKKVYRPRGKTLNKYIIAMILQAYCGLRISEIFGLKPEASLCCKNRLTEKRVENERGNKVKIKTCIQCGKEWASYQYARGHKLEGWDIEPLTPDRIRNNQIIIKGGKGEKDRRVWKPRALTEEMINELPLNLGGRAYQKFINNLSLKVIGRKISSHVLRHTFATLYLKKTPNDLRGLQMLLGHSRLDTTAIYSHISIDDLIERQARVEE